MKKAIFILISILLCTVVLATDTEFHDGDRVIVTATCSGSIVGHEYVVEEFIVPPDNDTILRIPTVYSHHGSDSVQEYCYCQDKWQLKP